jgi:hypothetical protein
VNNPEPVRVFRPRNGVQQAGIQPFALPFRQGREIPQIAITRRYGKYEAEFADFGCTRRYPPIGHGCFTDDADVWSVAGAQAFANVSDLQAIDPR